MTETFDDEDGAVLSTLRTLYEQLDPTPPDLAERVKLAMTIEALHAELAELTSTPLVASRSSGATPSDTITFSTQDLSLMVAVSDLTAATMTVDGWLSIGDVDVEVHAAGTTTTVRADANGRFALTGVARGRTWFLVLPGERDTWTPVVTPTVDL